MLSVSVLAGVNCRGLRALALRIDAFPVVPEVLFLTLRAQALLTVSLPAPVSGTDGLPRHRSWGFRPGERMAPPRRQNGNCRIESQGAI